MASAPYEFMRNHFPSAGDREISVREYVLGEIRKNDIDVNAVDCLVRNESGWNEWAMYDNKNGAGVDRGLFMFNSIWHKEISNECSFSVECATREFIKIYKQDGNFHQWWGYVNNCK